ncbi:MAG: ABC transporter substrate-binding protein [Actinobacteria bacterium]|nr:ABC transporter substrate-binding protein [Actinomycetota bacterium]
MKGRKALLTAALAVAAVSAAMVTAANASSVHHSRALADITIASLPVADSALAQVAMDRGYFTQRGLNAKFSIVATGPATTAAIVSGSAQFSQSNYATLIQARSQRVPVTIVTEAARAAAGFTGVYVLPDSSIQSPKDLEGKRVSTSVLGGIGPVLIDRYLKSKGVDYTKIQWVQMPFGNMGAALQQKQIDAAWVVEPITTQLKEQLNARQVFDISSGITQNVPFAGWATNQNWAKAHPGLVRAFQLAIRDAGAYAKAHKGTIRNAIPEYTTLKQADVSKLHLEAYPDTTSAAAIKRVADYMKDTGALSTTFHVQNMIWPQPKAGAK